jgi:hypothetical protein
MQTPAEAPAPAISADPPDPEGSIAIPAGDEGHDAGVRIQAGAAVTIVARGSWSHGTQDWTRPFYGPEGYAKTDAAALDPDARIGELIYRVGSGPWRPAGARVSFTSDAEGELYLSMNDDPGAFVDNQGSLRAVVTVR